MWINEAEQNGYAGVDDDGNGYIDDIHGIDAYYDDSDPQNGIQTHGTHVAGIMGANTNNALGVAGVNWNVKIATCKFLNFWGYGTMADAVECVNYFNTLKEDGVNIVATNNSWGWLTDGELLKDAIRSARDLDIVMVAAAGNNAGSNDKFPIYPASTNIDNIISVGATNSDDLLAWFSNYGSNVDIAAPGDDVYSTIDHDRYDYKSGTSMATPHVTGAIALISALHPEYTYKEKIEAIYNSADTISAFDGKIVNNRRLNLANLVTNGNLPDDGTDGGDTDTPDDGTDGGDTDTPDDNSTPAYEKVFPTHQYITTDGIDFDEFNTADHTITNVTATLNGSLFAKDTQALIDITSSNSFNAYFYERGMNKIVSCIIEDNIIKVKGAYISFGNYTRDGRMYNFRVATSDNDRYIGIHTLSISYK